MGMGGQPPEPKGDILELWKTLGLNIPTHAGMGGINPDIVWQSYNPHRKLENIQNANDAWLFVLESPVEGEDYLSQESKITANLRELMFLFAGAIDKEDNRDDLKITDLVTTRPDASGLISFDNLQNQMRTGGSSAQLKVLQGPPTGSQTLAVLIEGVAPLAAESSDEEANETAEAKEEDTADDSEATSNAEDAPARPIRAVYVTDVDFMHQFFSENRKRPEQFEELHRKAIKHSPNAQTILNPVALTGEIISKRIED